MLLIENLESFVGDLMLSCDQTLPSPPQSAPREMTHDSHQIRYDIQGAVFSLVVRSVVLARANVFSM